MKPTIYYGQELPFDKLNDKEFAKFILVIVPFIFPELEVKSTPPDTWDKGFDVWARNKDKDYDVCIQCKKYSTKLTLTHIAEEIAKVSLTSLEEGLNVKEHLFFTLNGVNSDTYPKIKKGNIDLIEKSEEILQTSKFKTTKKRLSEKGKSYDNAVKDYLTNLDTLDVYNQTKIDGTIAKRWTSFMENIAERFFSVQNVIREYPRPDFDYDNYVSKIKQNPLKYYTGIRAKFYSESVKFSLEQNNSKIGSEKKIDLNNLIDVLPKNKVSFLIGIGGSGKTVTCEILKHNVLDREIDDNPLILPIYIKAALINFKPLKELIDIELNINYGVWDNMPYQFILFIDGLNELSDEKAKAVLFECKNLVESKSNVTTLITTRKGKNFKKLAIDKENIKFEIQNLRYVDIRKMYNMDITDNLSEDFIIEVDEKYNHLNLFRSPFFIAKALKIYKEKKCLKDDITTMISNHYRNRFIINREGIDDNLSPIIDFEILEELTSAIAYNIYIRESNHSFSHRSLIEVINTIKETIIAISEVTISNLIQLLLDLEILIFHNDFYEFEHENIADYYASKIIAKNWRQHLYFAEDESKELLWIFVSTQIGDDEYTSFIEKTSEKNLLLSSICLSTKSDSNIHLLDKTIFKSYHIKSNFSVWLATRCMVTIGHDGFKSFLLDEYKTVLDVSVKEQIERALAALGEPDICQRLLDEAEKDHSIPFMSVTNGAEDTFKRLPLRIRLEWSNKRISGYISNQKSKTKSHVSENCSFSLNLLLNIGINDKDLRKYGDILRDTQEFGVFFYCFFLILFSNIEDSNELLLSSLKRVGLKENLIIFNESIKHGITLHDNDDIEFLINFLAVFLNIKRYNSFDEEIVWDEIYCKNYLSEKKIQQLSEENYFDVKHFKLIEDIVEYLLNIQLDSAHITKIYNYLIKDESIQQFNYFWDICLKYKYDKVDLLAREVIDSGNTRVIAKALRYLYITKLITPEIQDNIREIVKQPNDLNPKSLYEILLISVKSSGTKIGEYIIETLEKYINIDYNDIEFPDNYFIILYLKLYSYLDIENSNIVQMAITLNATASYSNFDEVFVRMFNKIGANNIDSYIKQGVLYNKNIVIALSKMNQTQYIQKVLNYNVINYGRLVLIKELFNNTWNNSIVDSVIKRLLNENDYNDFNYEALNDKFTQEQVDDFVNPAINNTKEPKTKKILELWRDNTLFSNSQFKI